MKNVGAITDYIDVAQLVLYAFWLFFFGLVIYLRREDKREGYPLESDRSDRAPRVKIVGYPVLPKPKTFRLGHGEGVVTVPNPHGDNRPIAGRPFGNYVGAPLEPTGNGMLDNIGPGSYAQRDDVPDLTAEGHPKIVPLRAAKGFYVPKKDPQPIGMQVFGADGVVAGQICDIWIDLSEPQIRYFEVAVAGGSRRALLPTGFARIDGENRRIDVKSVLGHQFAAVPAIARDDRITRLEEDRICAYYGGGTLYAEPSRLGPVQ